jgi:hypothetical protein
LAFARFSGLCGKVIAYVPVILACGTFVNSGDIAFDPRSDPVINSKDVAINANIKALQNLAKVNPVRATEINLQAIQGRLNRAEAAAERGNDKGVEKALEEFEKLRRFGEEISQIAQGLGKDVDKVEELVARAASMHLGVLAEVYERLPEQARPAVERAMEESMKGYERAAEALEKAGSGNIPERPDLPAVVPEEIRDRLKPSPHSEKAGASDNITEQSTPPPEVPEEIKEKASPTIPQDIPGRVPPIPGIPGRR